MKYSTVYLFVILITFSCSPTNNKEDNLEVSNAKEVINISGEATQFIIDTDKSLVTWIGSKPAGKHNGYIPIQTGHIASKEGKIVGGKITMDINGIRSIDLHEDHERHDRLVNHLKSDDFFDAANFPTAIFEISSLSRYTPDSIKKVKEEFESEHKPASSKEHIIELPTHSITGNLTMRDTTLSITFPANLSISTSQIKAAAKFNIDRTKWNLTYRNEASVADKTKDRFIYNTVNVGFEIVATIKE